MAAKNTQTPPPEPAKADDTALPQPPAPVVNTSTDKDGIERVVTLADPNWEPAPVDVVYPNLVDNEADSAVDTKKDTKSDK
jgi:hypothetical protein